MNRANKLLSFRRDHHILKNLIMGSNFSASYSSSTLQTSDNNVKKLLFTPGPLLTTQKVKQAMLVDLGSRDAEFLNVINYIQAKLLALAGLEGRNDYVTVLMQGSGTFGVESVLQTTANKQASYLILENGAYGKRMANICKLIGVPHHVESWPENRAIDLPRLNEFLTQSGQKFTHVGVIHSETTSGVLNKVQEIGKVVKKHLPNSTYIVDSMSAFGAVPVDLVDGGIDFLVSSSNKCIQSVPGFSFVICNKEKLLACKNNSKSLSLDLCDQYENMSKTSQFRFTPPTHSLLAFRQALVELEEEGGPSKRYERYSANYNVVRDEFLRMGFRELVPVEEQGRIINTFYYPSDSNFVFEKFYKLLSDKGKVIYPGKMSIAPCFRIGNIGDLHPDDMKELVESVKQVLGEMNVKIPVQL